MVRLLIRAVIYLGTAALGLLVASWIVPGFHLEGWGFLIAILVFAVAQSVLSPFILKMSMRFAPAIIGGIGLVSTFVALLIANLVPDGIRLDDPLTWVFATLVVWLVTALGTWLLPLIFLKDRVQQRRGTSPR